MAVATTTSPSNVEHLCRSCFAASASDVFDVVAAGDQVANKKPAPDIYLLALSRLALRPDQCLVFEDSSNGVMAALGAGLRVIVTPSAYTGGENFEGADRVLENLLKFDMALDADRAHGLNRHSDDPVGPR